MQLSAGSTFYGVFTNSGSTGSRNADSLPTASLYRNGVIDNTVAVAVTNLAAGLYSVSGILPSTYNQGDQIAILVTSTTQGLTLAPYDVLDITISDSGPSSTFAPGASFSALAYTNGQFGAVNADTLPTGVAVHNGTIDSSVAITVTNIGTGLYTLTGYVPSNYNAGDDLFILVSATVNTYPGLALVLTIQVGGNTSEIGVGPFIRVWSNQVIYTVAGATGPCPEVLLQDANLNPFPTESEYGAKCAFQLAMAPGVNVVALTGISTVETASDGSTVCRYYPSTTDFENWGSYQGQFLVTLGNGMMVIVPNGSPFILEIAEANNN